MNQVQYKTVNITLDNSEVTKTANIDIPDGIVTHIGTVTQGNTENKILDLEILQRGSRVVEPMDVKFSERTAGGTFHESLMPVNNLVGGSTYQARITANELTRTNDIVVQVLFVVVPLEQTY